MVERSECHTRSRFQLAKELKNIIMFVIIERNKRSIRLTTFKKRLFYPPKLVDGKREKIQK